jgi:cytoskeletal protein CcmA (bactofilin family)
MFNKYKRTTINKSDIENLLGEDQADMSLAKGLKEDVLAIQKPSIISVGAVFDGNFTFKGSLHLDGHFKGNLKVDKITIGKNGVFNGKLNADVVVVMGVLKGEVKCSELSLIAYSNVSAKISYDSIKMQPGSSISGDLICTNKINL